MKKYSWIVALLLALSFTAIFIGCGAEPVEPPPPELGAFVEYELGDFNTWGGGAAPGSASQQGWATDGFTWVDGGKMTAKSLGYELDAFLDAAYLVLEFEEAGTIQGGVSIIWGGSGDEGDTLGGWNSTQVVANSGAAEAAHAKKEDTKLTVDITSLTKYATHYKTATEGLRFVVAYYSPDVKSLKISKAYLLIPTEELPFVPIETLTITTLNKAYLAPATAPATGVTGDIALNAAIEPANATRQTISWAIDFNDPATTLNPSQVFFKTSPIPGLSYADPVVSKNVLTATADGKVVVYAIVPNGTYTNLAAEEGDDDFEVLAYKAEKITIETKGISVQSALKFGASGAGNIAVKSNQSEVTIGYLTDNSGYTFKNTGDMNWEGMYCYFPLNLGAGGSINDYIGVQFTVTDANAAAQWKSVMVAVRDGDFAGGWITGQGAGNDDVPYPNADGRNDYTSGTQTVMAFFTATATNTTSTTPSICIHLRASGALEYTIKDVKLIKPAS